MFAKLPDSEDIFYKAVLKSSVRALKLNHYTDNFDARRYNYDGKDHSNDFDAGYHAYHIHWFCKNHPKLYQAYLALDDEVSRRLFLHLIAYRLAGHMSVKIPVTYNTDPRALEEYRNMESAGSTPSGLKVSGMLGKVRHLDFQYRGHRYVIDGIRLESMLFRGQYFYERDGIRIAPEKGDHAIDGGAFLGDTACVFSNAVGPEGKVYSFDPVANNLEVINYNIRQFEFQNVKVFPFGLSDVNVHASPIVLNNYEPTFSGKGDDIPARTLDHLVQSGEVERVDFIKLDVEGAELSVLKGAKESIARFRPRLAISLYHKPEDLYQIILYIKEHFPFYSQHIDHYTIHSEETVLYCMDKSGHG